MKNLLVSIAAIISGSILLSSCNQSASLTLTKRHYTKGYYVDYNSKKGTEKPQAVLLNDGKENIGELNITQRPKMERQVVVDNIVLGKLHKTETNEVVSQNPQNSNKSILVRTNKLANYKSATPIMAMPKALSKSGSQFENAPQGITAINQDGDHRVHSLFWTVIAIILILWLIGILTGGFGLGVLINLLLLIAVVLFILWLLWLI